MKNDTEVIVSNCQRAQALGVEISDATARAIAAQFHGGQVSAGLQALPALALSIPGALPAIWRDLGSEYGPVMSANDRLMLDMLGTYLLNRADRGPVADWSDLWVR